MTTSGTTSWTPDLGEVFEEAFERAGLELRSGYDIKTARRSLNFLLTEWANKGLNLWTVRTGTITLVPGQSVCLLTQLTILSMCAGRITPGSTRTSRSIAFRFQHTPISRRRASLAVHTRYTLTAPRLRRRSLSGPSQIHPSRTRLSIGT